MSPLTFRGLTAAPAEVRATPDGVAYLYVLVRQPDPAALPILGRQRYSGTAAGHQAAHAKAHALRAGSQVVLTGGALVAGRWLGEPVLLLTGNAEVQLVDVHAVHERITATEAQ